MRVALATMIPVTSLLLSSCRTPSAAEAEAVPLVEITQTVGRVLKVNEKQRYVVVDCVSLPSKGEVAIVYEGDNPVGRLRITGSRRSPFVVADILEGEAKAGNTVRVVRRRRAEAAQLEESK